MDQEKELAILRQTLHDLYFASNVTMNTEEVRNILGKIARWSYAHRAGNGELSDEEVSKNIEDALNSL